MANAAAPERPPYFDIYTGERLVMRGTAIGREASRMET